MRVACLVLLALVVVSSGAAGDAPYALDNPAQLLVAKDGALLVAERGAQNRILRVDPATGAFTVFATGVPSPFALASAPDGSLLVSSTSGLYRVRGGKPHRITPIGMSPIVVLPDGRIAFGHETSVGILRPGSAKPRLFRATVNYPHGLARLRNGDLVVSDTGSGRLLRLDARGRARVIASRLRSPMALALEPSGSVLVIVFDTGSVMRISMSGRKQTVTRGFTTPYGLTRAPDRTLYVTEAGDVASATGKLWRIAPGGTPTQIALHPAS
jgi:glucose/arabinose dehydrogenase